MILPVLLIRINGNEYAEDLTPKSLHFTVVTVLSLNKKNHKKYNFTKCYGSSTRDLISLPAASCGPLALNPFSSLALDSCI
jgi:hypothetical protein